MLGVQGARAGDAAFRPQLPLASGFPLSPMQATRPGSPEAARSELAEFMKGDRGTVEIVSFDGRATCPEGGRPPSAMSTSAGATPSPTSRSPQHPGQRGDTPGTGGQRRQTGARIGTQGGARRDGNPGKVFVGGVPQDMTSDDLYSFFRSFGAVKRAWLQSNRAVGRDQTRPHLHRGFGFVIFSDESSVDGLLGLGPSRFLSFPDGRRMEVKRAVPSAEMPGSDGGAGSPAQPRQEIDMTDRGGRVSSPLQAGACGAREQYGLMRMAPPLPMAGSPMQMPQPMHGAYSLAAPLQHPQHPQLPQHPHHPQHPQHQQAQQSSSEVWPQGVGATPPLQPWPAQLGFSASLDGSQTAVMPQLSALTQHSMMMAPVSYTGGYGAFQQNMAAMTQQNQRDSTHGVAHGVAHTGPAAGYPGMQGFPAMGLQAGVQQPSW